LNRVTTPSVKAGSSAGSDALTGVTFELQELWFSLMSRNWRSLAFVPAREGGSSLQLARKFVSIGKSIQGATLALLEGAQLDLETAAKMTQQLQGTRASAWATTSPGGAGAAIFPDARIIVALDAVLENALSIPVALATDGVVLVVESGVTTTAQMEHSLQLLGRDRVLGAVMVGR